MRCVEWRESRRLRECNVAVRRSIRIRRFIGNVSRMIRGFLFIFRTSQELNDACADFEWIGVEDAASQVVVEELKSREGIAPPSSDWI